MRWKIQPAPDDPKEGDTRYIRKFAWLPTIINNYKVWLETYGVTQEYKAIPHKLWKNYREMVTVHRYEWVDIRRETLDYYI